MKSIVSKIFAYEDYREFLKDSLAELKSQDAKYSQRFVLSQIGVASSGWLSDIFKGRKNITQTSTHRFIEFFQMNPREASYFESLIAYNQAGCLEEKSRFFNRLAEFNEATTELVNPDQFEYFSKWYHTAIRETLLTKPFFGDFVSLAKTMDPVITPAQAKKSVQLLENLGMVKKQGSGEFKPVSLNVTKQNNFNPVHYFQHMKEMREVGGQSLERKTKDERNFSTLGAALSRESYDIIIEDIVALRQKILSLSEQENVKQADGVELGKRKVIQYVFEAFPLTKDI